MKQLNSDQKLELEELIDKYGVDSLINAIEEICLEKADHVASTYGDKELAGLWQKVATSLGKPQAIASDLPH